MNKPVYFWFSILELIQKKHIHMEQAKIKYVRKEIKCNNIIRQYKNA